MDERLVLGPLDDPEELAVEGALARRKEAAQRRLGKLEPEAVPVDAFAVEDVDENAFGFVLAST